MDSGLLFPDDELATAPPAKKDRRAILEGAERKPCAGPNCKAIIFWAMRGDRPHPYDADGRSHFGTCPDAAKFRRAT